jgi:hypothetical protein
VDAALALEPDDDETRALSVRLAGEPDA